MLGAPVALIAPLRESSIVIGAFLACWLFREEPSRTPDGRGSDRAGRDRGGQSL